MKTYKKIGYLFFFMLVNYSCAVQQKQPTYEQDGSVDFQVFYDQLSPYGNWVDYSNYGYVWIPDVRREFAPYSTNGHWIMTDFGWTWVSDYRWGWAPFHYGRWDYDDYYGWFWVPDNDWGPAWVTWRSGNGYYGWAPMRPGMNINNSFNDEYRDINRWHFVRDRDFDRRDIQRYYVNRGYYGSIINNSTVINNTIVDRRRNATYVAGPPEDNVQRSTGRTVNRVRILDNERPGQKLDKDELKIYRPQVQRTTDRNTAPSKVTQRQDIKPVRERGTANQRNNMTSYENKSEQQQTAPVPPTERRRNDRQPAQQQPIDKNVQIQQNQTNTPNVNPSQDKITQERNEIEKRQSQRKQQIEKQNRQIEQNQTAQPQPQTVPQPSPAERDRILKEQTEQQDRTKQEQLVKQQQLEIQKQQRQVERQQQQIDRQQQLQRRRQERQEIKQQQREKSQQIPQTQPTKEQNEQEKKTTTPSGNRRR